MTRGARVNHSLFLKWMKKFLAGLCASGISLLIITTALGAEAAPTFNYLPPNTDSNKPDSLIGNIIKYFPSKPSDASPSQPSDTSPSNSAPGQNNQINSVNTEAIDNDTSKKSAVVTTYVRQNSTKRAPDTKALDPTSAKKISLNFTTIKVQVLLQLFAQFTGLNFIISDKVQGDMAVHIKNTPWPQALEAILAAQGLGKREIGDTVIIAPLADIEKSKTAELQYQQTLADLQTKKIIQALESETKIDAVIPLQNRIFRIKYANAADIAEMITKQGLLSARGKIGVNKATNSLWIKDIPSQIIKMVRLIRKLDFPDQQIVIDARLVNISRPYEQQLGIRWGVSSKINRLSGTLEGANTLINSVGPAAVPLLERLNFNVPVTQLGSSTSLPATVGIALAKLGNFNVDIELSALEEEGKLVTISNPRLITSNLEEASIETGEQIPYQSSTSSGATAVSFVDATLSLKVTPRITADNRVLLKLVITNNSPGPTVPLAGGGSAIPINTQEEHSTVLVNDKQTIVLGGVFKRSKQNSVTRIPYLGQIPIIGYLFKQTTIVDNRDELIIFLTPRILHKPNEINQE